MKKIIFLLLCSLLFFSKISFSAQDLYQFNDPKKQELFDDLTHQLRCLVCQNQNLAESNAPLATDLRNKVYEQITAGKSKNEVIDYLVSRYGKFILYRPVFELNTIGLWLGPFVLLFFGLTYLFFYIRKQR